METISEIIQHWKAEKIQLNPPATLETIRRAEEITSYRFPSDFKDFYLIADGFTDCDWTPNMFFLWPLQRIIDEYLEELFGRNVDSSYQKGRTGNFLGFCDYLINSHQIGFLKDRKGVYKSYDEFSPIAQSFCEVLSLIKNDAALIY